MAFDQFQMNTMERLATEYGADMLFGAICINAMQVVTEIIADMAHDKDRIAIDGMPSKQNIIDMTIDQVCVYLPDSMLEIGEINSDCQQMPDESAFRMLIRGITTQIVKQHPELMRVVYQPR